MQFLFVDEILLLNKYNLGITIKDLVLNYIFFVEVSYVLWQNQIKTNIKGVHKMANDERIFRVVDFFQNMATIKNKRYHVVLTKEEQEDIWNLILELSSDDNIISNEMVKCL